jgi:redox-sensitive bicupin YhaK (pirin superfamily)
MSLTLRPARDRGQASHGWLDSAHTFSFADYHDPAHMGFRALRVINDDVIQPAKGFGQHGHRDMEIVTYVVRGALAHQDTIGGRGVLTRGDVQAMSAGTGLRHSEFNASDSEEVRLLQIWILPEQTGTVPGYHQQTITDAAKTNVLRLIADRAGSDGALHIGRDAAIYAALLDPGVTVAHALGRGRGAWVQVVAGDLDLNGVAMTGGDGAAIEAEDTVTLTARGRAEILLFDLD